ncbi:MAG: RHS repeat-associated core domain-containing protein [Chthonomonadaceae bacterium]|nr:MAG: RHS repeat-associated core domain-containing protein [Chthonomonadaceae bacterium]
MRYGVGARGIHFMTKRVEAGEEIRGFPLYDGHGNMIATLGRSESSPYFGVADLRSYDVWGAVRSGSTTGDPKQRYCANLGHVQDDASGLIYMRARYYEPWSGRFISEDPARDGFNSYVYCLNIPTVFVDESGMTVHAALQALLFLAGFILGQTLGYTIAVLIFMSLEPRFIVDHLASKALFSTGLAILSFLGGLGFEASKDDFALFNKPLTDMAKSIRRSLARVGHSRVAGAAGLGLLLGAIFGVLQATWEAILWRIDHDAGG